MRKKVKILLDEDVLRRAKRRALEEGRPLIGLVHEALDCYLSERMTERARREAAYQLFCERPMRFARGQLKAVLRYDS